VDADQVLALLVDDRVDRDRGLPGLAVADDQLALPAADWSDRVDHLDAGLDRRVDVLPHDDAWRDDVDRSRVLRFDVAFAVERASERIDDAPDERVTDRRFGDASGGADLAALDDSGVVAQDDRADGVFL